MPAVKTMLTWEAAEAAGVAAGALELDATSLLGFETTAEVTEHPVERGPNVADHIRPMNGTLAMEGVITDHPIALPATQMNGATLAPAAVDLPGGGRATVQRFSADVDRVRLCDALLQTLVDGGVLVTVTTGLRTTDSLAIARHRAERNGETGESVKVTLEFKRVRLATTARAPVPLVRRAQVQSDRGAQPADNRTAGTRLADTAPMRALAERPGAR